MLVASAASGSIVQFAATIDGAQETPPNGSTATATGTFTMDTIASTLSINVVIGTAPPSGEIAAHIHGFSPPGTPSGIQFPLPLGSPKVTVWNFTATDTGSIVAGLAYVNIHSTAFPAGEIRGQIVRVPSCGDGILDGGEDCDDGNTSNGDCCSSTCEFEPEDSECVNAMMVCGSGRCNSTGSCLLAPRSGCRSALKSLLVIKDVDDDSKDKLIWKWSKGEATEQADFGDPTAATYYEFCVYAGTATALVADAQVTGPWSAIGTTGYKYSVPSGLPSGIQKAILKGGDAGRAKAKVKGKGTNLPDRSEMPMGLPLPVTAQLISSDAACFESSFDAADVIKNDSEQFKFKTQ
jgi:cysteine-rich repeat protein